ncbi:MAG: glycosyltransferase [Stenomitos rutilans HA7619-LM2]|nr:glycosyltransferase [Stenomitos rutilans HA7619-LM2]
MTSACFRVTADLPTWSSPPVPFQPLVQCPPSPQCEVCVIVPVRNEAEMLESTLAALTHQVDLEGRPFDSSRYEVILLANNCSDNSVEIAHHFAAQHPNLVLHIVEEELPSSKAHIGWVRKQLMDEACHRLKFLGCNRGVIASTDGDTRVASNWIAATQHEIACGVDAVGGRIITDRGDRATLEPYARACHLREVGYRFLVAELEAYLDPDSFDRLPRHFQHYGASLAVTAEIYEQAGGMPAVRTSEDVALYCALMRVNARFRHSPLVRVATSARSIGRAQSGLADQLSKWNDMGQQQQAFLVEPAGAIATRFQAHHELRQRWLDGYPLTFKEIALLANRLGVDGDWLVYELTQHASLEGLFEAIKQQQNQEGIWQQRWVSVRIEQAISDLRLLLEPFRSQSGQLPAITKALSLPTT